MAKGKKKSVDVRSKKDIAEFENLLSTGPITIVLVYADWCGHCQNFKKEIWNDLQNMPNKKVNLASVHYDQLPNTSQRDAKINGYPSLLVIGNDGKPASFNVNGEVTNALPDSRNKEMLETMVTTEPVNIVNTLEKNNVNVNEVTTLNFQPETLEKRNEMNNVLTENINSPLPPNTTEDRITLNNYRVNNEPTQLNETEEKQKGGSLLRILMKLAQQTAPAAALLGAAAYRSKGKSRKNKKSKKRTTRRR
jgi:thiol-disulfide isomerase/thioredoxin